MITKDSREAEIERNKPRKYFKKNSNDDLFFRKYYAEDKDSIIMKIMYFFFSAVQDVFIDQEGNSFGISEIIKINLQILFRQQLVIPLYLIS